MNLLEAVDDPLLFGPWFRDRATWTAWFGFIAALFALPMDDAQLAAYRRHTGRDEPPGAPHKEAWLPIGRRGGKSFVMALIAVYLATFRDYRPHLHPPQGGFVFRGQSGPAGLP